MSESFAVASAPGPARSELPLVRIARKGGLALSIRIAGAGVAFVTQMALARLLGHAGYGEFAYTFGWLQLMLVFAQGGFSTAALRFVAEYRVRRQSPELRGFLTRSSQIALVESAVIAVLLAGCAAAWSHSESQHTLHNFLIASAALPALSQIILHSAIVRGFGHIIPSMACGLVQPLVFVTLLITAACFLRGGLASTDALLLMFAAALCALAIIVSMRRRYERDLKLGSQCAFRTNEWARTATQMMFATSLVYLHSRTGVVISGMLLNPGAAGTYALMERITDAAGLGLTAINVLAAPTFAGMHVQGRKAELQTYARLAAWGATGFTLAVAVPLVFFGMPLLRMFGDKFVPGYPVLLVLLAGAVVNAITGTSSLLLAMTGNHRLNTVIALASTSVNLTLSFCLTPIYGIVGTAVAYLASLVVWNASVLLLVRRRLGIWSSVGRIALLDSY
jgi:O-antigen/teichoic acid export membrane protein